MAPANACLGLIGCWLAAGIDAHRVEALLWLSQCAQANLLTKLSSVYSLSHALAFPCSFAVMILMSVWHISNSGHSESRAKALLITGSMWLFMFPICLISEQLILFMPATQSVQMYAFLMLAVSSAMMQLINHKNLFPK